MYLCRLGGAKYITLDRHDALPTCDFHRLGPQLEVWDRRRDIRHDFSCAPRQYGGEALTQASFTCVMMPL